MTVDVQERGYISRFATDPIGLLIHKQGVPADADANAVEVTWIREGDPDVTVFTRMADHEATGVYGTSLSSVETSEPGDYLARFTYALDGVEQVYETYLVIGPSAPSYDNLAPAMKDIVDRVWLRFADLFDSPDGGPNLQVYFQTHYGRGRMAQLLQIAVGLLNTTAQPFQTYTLDGDGGATFPVEKWGSLLESALYVEAIKHLVRSYTEQPLFQGGSGITRHDRRDYMDRWRAVLDMEQPTLRSQLQVFKISNMNLGRPKVLVSGGVYGRYGPTRLAGSIAARPRYYARFY